MGKKIRTEEVDHLFEAILCLKNKKVWKYMKKERIFTWKKRSYIRWSLLFNRKLM